MSDKLIVLLIWIAIAWTIVWKYIAFWMAARRKHKAWYIVMCIVQTVGILEILYIFIFSKKAKK